MIPVPCLGLSIDMLIGRVLKLVTANGQWTRVRIVPTAMRDDRVYRAASLRRSTEEDPSTAPEHLERPLVTLLIFATISFSKNRDIVN